MDDVAADWIAHWGRNQTEAMCALINFVIKCTGCDIQVTTHDIDDPDNVVSKLSDMQDEYQAQKPAEYPLVSKVKSNASFRQTMVNFIKTLIMACHAQGLLYSDSSIMENLEIWVSTMSSASIRPFRHTATVTALTVGNTLCNVAADTAESIAKISRQKEGEQKKKRVNEARVKDLQKSITELDRKLTQIKESLQTTFDTVFVHRYRDVDPKIRQECVTALGTWISTFPDVFFEGLYLRYLGWVLSDPSAPTRAEVVKQLLKLYKNKDNVARLRTFTDRFRPRIIEMAMQDADLNIRISTIELLELVRETELLEPDDIDNIGRLIYDLEPRIRKAVAGFFAENINDLYETTLDEFGGKEGLAEILGEEVEDEHDRPRPGWLKLKSMVECLQSYDIEEGSAEPRRHGADQDTARSDTRLSLAAQNIHEVLPEARDWEALAGYLLHDFSQAGQTLEAPDAAFKERCKLNENEQACLLEIIDVAVKWQFQEASEGEVDKKSRKNAKQKDESRKAQETMAVRLAQMIPRLLKKFGSNPSTASPILALGSIMNLEIFQELRQDSTTYASLLDDINKQFLSHSDQEVLTEATNALLHAQEYEDLNEVTEGKIQELWDDTIKDLRTCLASPFGEDLTTLCDTVKRIASLANVFSCVSVFESEGRANPKKRTSKLPTASPLNLLTDLIHEPALDQSAGEDAVEILTYCMRAVRCYYMWVTVARQAEFEAKRPLSDLPDFTPFVSALTAAAKIWPSISEVRQVACSCILDVHTLYARFRHTPSTSSAEPLNIPHVPREPQPLIMQTFTALEKRFARLSRKRLETTSTATADVDPDAPPASDDEDERAPQDSSAEEEEDLDSESDDAADNNAADGHAAEKRKMRALLAEESLCRFTYSIMLAIIGKVLDADPSDHPGRIRERLQRNRTRLGGSFKETLAQTDDTPPVAAKAGARKAAKLAAAAAGRAASDAPRLPSAAPGDAGNTAKVGAGTKGNYKSAATVNDDDEDDDDVDESHGEGGGGDGGGADGGEDDDEEEEEEEEDGNRELSEDRIEDVDAADAASESAAAAADKDDEIMGD